MPAILVVALSLSACSFLLGPDLQPAWTGTVEPNPELVERGRYLFRHVAMCAHCHSPRALNHYAQPFIPSAEGAGGDCFGEEIGLPGRVCMPNITPDTETGVGGWSDGELIRAVREGVRPDGEAIFPLMRYPDFRHMSDADVRAVVAYIRQLAPLRQEVRPRDIPWIVERAANHVPAPVVGPVVAPSPDDTVAYGEYLVRLAGCEQCHSPNDGFGYIEEARFSGGVTLRVGGADVVSSNLTPHETGLEGWTRARFVGLFGSFASAKSSEVPSEVNTVMPWYELGGMTPEDVGAIYDYLRTLPPRSRYEPR